MLRRTYIGISPSKAIDLSLTLCVFSLLGGRGFSVFIYERDLFHGKYLEMASFWHGGMALTGVVAGIIAAILVFCWIYKKTFLVIADEIVIPLCLLLLLIQVGNHINGEAYGSITGAWWGVKFPHADGFRHPVGLYEALKDLIIFFLLLSIAGNADPGRGKMTGQFIFWSGLGSLIIDYLNTPHHMVPKIGLGQFFSLLLIIVGLLLIIRAARKKKKKYTDLSSMQFAPISFRKRRSIVPGPIFLRIVLFAVILMFCLTLPSEMSRHATRDPASRAFNRTI